MNNTPIIDVRDCRKTFRVHKKAPGLKGSLQSLFYRKREPVHALTGVNLQVFGGEIIGLVGANGAGKTTLVKILSGIIHPTSGHVSVLGHNPWKRQNEFRSQISLIMGQKAQLWWDLPAADCFLLLREIYRIPNKEFEQRVHELAAPLQVEHLLTTQIRRLSLGERMKLELIATLLHRPKVVFLDEPTIGLDLTSQRTIRNFILSYREKYNPAMIVTSHYMEDIKTLCKRIAIIRKGQILYDGSIDHIVEEHIHHKVIAAKMPNANGSRPNLPETIGNVISHEDGVLRIQVRREKSAEAARFLLQHGQITELSIEEEDISTIIESLQTEGVVT